MRLIGIISQDTAGAFSSLLCTINCLNYNLLNPNQKRQLLQIYTEIINAAEVVTSISLWFHFKLKTVI